MIGYYYLAIIVEAWMTNLTINRVLDAFLHDDQVTELVKLKGTYKFFQKCIRTNYEHYKKDISCMFAILHQSDVNS